MNVRPFSSDFDVASSPEPAAELVERHGPERVVEACVNDLVARLDADRLPGAACFLRYTAFADQAAATCTVRFPDGEAVSDIDTGPCVELLFQDVGDAVTVHRGDVDAATLLFAGRISVSGDPHLARRLLLFALRTRGSTPSSRFARRFYEVGDNERDVRRFDAAALAEMLDDATAVIASALNTMQAGRGIEAGSVLRLQLGTRRGPDLVTDLRFDEAGDAVPSAGSDKPALATLRLRSAVDVYRIVTGKIDAASAYLSGAVSVEGDLAFAFTVAQAITWPAQFDEAFRAAF